MNRLSNTEVEMKKKTLLIKKCVYNLGQRVGDKFTKLSKIGFSMECFTPDFLQFLTKKRQNLALGWAAGYSLSNPSIFPEIS